MEPQEMQLQGMELQGEDFPTVDSELTREVEPVAVIDKLGTDEELHARVLSYLNQRLQSSEQAMTSFHPRWERAEKVMQIYIKRDAEEERKKNENKKDGPVHMTELVLPYAYSTVATIVTYLLHTFCGRKPMFTLGVNSGKGVDAARNHELLLQYQADHCKLVSVLRRYFMDGEVYGLCVLRTDWKIEERMVTKWVEQPGMGAVQSREIGKVYEGNTAMNIDPYLFFPDPSVEISKVSREGEFVFWRNFLGKHVVLGMEASGTFKHVKKAGDKEIPVDVATNIQRGRGILANGETENWRGNAKASKMYQVDQGTVEIVPAELGLGQGTTPTKWLFTILNKTQIVQAEPFTCDHNRHPIAVAEPYSLGYSFGQPSLLDYISPIQDGMSWMLNSHIFNVRSILNNTFIIDPTRVNIDDFKQSAEKGPKIIRLKHTALGADARTAVFQLPLTDVTTQHIGDIQILQRTGDTFSAVNDNLRGVNQAGGRKTATEVRQSGEAGASRLAAHAMLHSATGISDLAEMWVINNQQFLSPDFAVNVVGPDKGPTPHVITPQMIAGDFNFPIHDGTLPLDKVALLDVWKELFMGVLQDPQLRANYDVNKMFAYIAELGGVKNIEAMKLSVQSPQAIEAGLAAGQLAPTGIPANELPM